MTSFRFAIGLIAMALVATSTVKAATGSGPGSGSGSGDGSGDGSSSGSGSGSSSPGRTGHLTVGTTSSGDVVGSASATRFNFPYGVEVLPGDEVALVADMLNKRIVDVSLADGSTTEFMSTGSVNPRFLAVCDDSIGYFSSLAGVSAFDPSESPPRSPWVFLGNNMWTEGLACLKTDTHDWLFVAVARGTVGIGAYDRLKGPPTAGDYVWQVSKAELGVERVFGISLSPDMRHLAFAANTENKVGTVNLETKVTQLYGTGTTGVQDGPPDVAQFYQPYDVAWTPDGRKILVNEANSFDFSGLRFIDFAIGFVGRTANGLMPSRSRGTGVTVLNSTGEVLVTYNNALQKMKVNGVTPGCGYVPTVRNSDGGSNATAFGFVGDTVTYVCEAGFTSAGTSRITTCPSDTLTWSTVSDCQSDAEFIIAHLGNLTTAVKSTLKAVVKAYGMSLFSGDISQVTLQKWCEPRDFQ